MKKSLFLFIICLIISNIQAQDSTYARKIIRDLSAKEMYGRGYAHNGDSLAANYICNELEKIGAQPLFDTYRQPYSFYSYAMEGKVSMSIDGKILSPFNDYRISPTACPAHGDFDVMPIDVKVLLSLESQKAFRDKYENTLTQTFVYVDATNCPCTEDEKKALEQMLTRLNYSNVLNCRGYLIKVSTLPIWSWTGSDIERNHTVIFLTPEAVNRAPQRVNLDFNNRFHLHNTQNICAKIEGTVSPDTMIVFTAHYDHLGCMGDEVIFPGAHDNASGVATVLDLLKHYEKTPHKYTVVGLFFFGEEAGLRGSAQFLNNSSFSCENISMLLNFDLICGGDDGIMVVNAKGESTKPAYDKMVKINNKEHLLTDIQARDNARNSDHFYFSKCAPAMFIYTLGGRHGDYHHWNDTCEKCGLENYNNLLNLIIHLFE
ncbi:MAG: M28 family peptidase [Bacteroidales bacterium]|nr:M28 family peptidase [Bacteroidales bacterium]